MQIKYIAKPVTLKISRVAIIDLFDARSTILPKKFKLNQQAAYVTRRPTFHLSAMNSKLPGQSVTCKVTTIISAAAGWFATDNYFCQL